MHILPLMVKPTHVKIIKREEIIRINVSQVLISLLLLALCGSLSRKLLVLNIGTATNYYFVIACPSVQFNASGRAHAAGSWYKRSHAKSKLTRNEVLRAKLVQ